MNFSDFSKIAALVFIIFQILLIPSYIRGWKKHRENQSIRRKKEIDRVRIVESVYRFANEQKASIADGPVLQCWGMLTESLRFILKGTANMGILPTDTIEKFIRLIENNRPWEYEGLGEDLLTVELQPNDTLQVQLVSDTCQCKASLMLRELKKLEGTIIKNGIYPAVGR